jgi:hypothetical protein
MENPAHDGLFAPDVSPRRRISVGDCHILATCPAGSGPSVADATKSAVGLQPSGIEDKTLSHMDLVTYLAGGSSTSSPRGFVDPTSSAR